MTDYPLEDLRARIDWTPFLRSWELPGRWPNIDEHARREQAHRLIAEAEAILMSFVLKGAESERFRPIFSCSSGRDDIAKFADESRGTPIDTLHMLRQQMKRPNGRANLSLADFIAPAGTADWIGLFAVTAGVGLSELVADAEAAHDDYRAIMLKAVADRLAEAFAERLHERVRTEFWAYAPDEQLDNEALIDEAYSGIRPAPGYPACPDHTEKQTIFRLLDAETQVGVRLTDSFAMTPAASVSGYYFATPMLYFGMGRLGRDQVADYANERMDRPRSRKWLAPSLATRPIMLRDIVLTRTTFAAFQSFRLRIVCLLSPDNAVDAMGRTRYSTRHTCRCG